MNTYIVFYYPWIFKHLTYVGEIFVVALNREILLFRRDLFLRIRLFSIFLSIKYLLSQFYLLEYYMSV